MQSPRTAAIILRIIPFRESSGILHLFTAEQGRYHALARGIINKKNGETPLERGQLIDAVFYTKAGMELATLTQWSITDPFVHTATDIEKQAIRDAAFELLTAGVHESGGHAELFPFLIRFLVYLDKTPTPEVNPFALWLYCMRLSQNLGFAPELTSCTVCNGVLNEGGFFSVENGAVSCKSCVAKGGGYAGSYLSGAVLHHLRTAKPSPLELKERMNRSALDEVTDLLVDYCRFHFGMHGEIKSVAFLKAVTVG